MGSFRYNWYWTFIMSIVISVVIVHVEMSATPVINNIKLSDIEVRYLTERLSKQEHMCDYDILNTIAELEHFYTVVSNGDGIYEPSAMVDKAWHHHILNTKMYSRFSRQHFGMELLHHVPFWSENKEEVEELSSTTEQFDSIGTYNTIVSMFGSENVNKTVWFTSEAELNGEQLEIGEHTEF